MPSNCQPLEPYRIDHSPLYPLPIHWYDKILGSQNTDTLHCYLDLICGTAQCAIWTLWKKELIENTIFTEEKVRGLWSSLMSSHMSLIKVKSRSYVTKQRWKLHNTSPLSNADPIHWTELLRSVIQAEDEHEKRSLASSDTDEVEDSSKRPRVSDTDSYEPP